MGLDAISKTLENEECITLNKDGLEMRIGIFPYEWLDDVDKLNETELPHEETFYSELKPGGITDNDYKQPLCCWKEFECETMKDYMMVYLKQICY